MPDSLRSSVRYSNTLSPFKKMNLSHLNIEDRRKVELENLSKAEFSKSSLNLNGNARIFHEELKKHCGCIAVIKLNIKAENNMLWGSMGMQQFVYEFLNNENLKKELEELSPYEERFELKKDIKMGGNLFNLLGDMCAILKNGGMYSDGTGLKNKQIVEYTMDFIDQNLKEGYKMYHYIKIQEPWTKWFDPIWASTYLLLNLYCDEMMMICITDSD